MTKTGIFSSVHGGEILEYCKWDDQKAMAAFDRFQPDVVCGEVRPEDLESGGKKYPGEYERYIFDYCKSRGLPFIPCDYWTEEDYQLTLRESGILEAKLPDGSEEAKRWEAMMDRFMEAGLRAEIPFNSAEFNDIARHKHQMQGSLSPETHQQTWINRNRRIVENIRKVMAEHPGKNILIIFGAEHSYWFVDEFSEDKTIQLVFPL
ncbi:DUF5694 domain-containing protein [Oscillospiraceae bacterium 42-9]|jgi:hypothetical protein|uniref:DUF5694 domain-containing protein n=1 Tax=Acutalibacter sp. TaxID=1918636 RepID=UPI00216B941E|nr:hypothetical protein [Acutalibacter sp.]